MTKGDGSFVPGALSTFAMSGAPEVTLSRGTELTVSTLSAMMFGGTRARAGVPITGTSARKVGELNSNHANRNIRKTDVIEGLLTFVALPSTG